MRDRRFALALGLFILLDLLDGLLGWRYWKVLLVFEANPFIRWLLALGSSLFLGPWPALAFKGLTLALGSYALWVGRKTFLARVGLGFLILVHLAVAACWAIFLQICP